MGEADVCNYADDTTIYACDTAKDLVIDKLEKHSVKMANWFSKHRMKLTEENAISCCMVRMRVKQSENNSRLDIRKY